MIAKGHSFYQECTFTCLTKSADHMHEYTRISHLCAFYIESVLCQTVLCLDAY